MKRWSVLNRGNSKKLINLLLCILLLGATAVLSAQTDAGAPDILPAILTRLRERGWSEKEIEQFNGETHRYTWEFTISRQGSTESCADAVALSLAYMKGREDTDGLNENARLQVRLAYELMQAAQEMSMQGYNDQAMTRMALNGTRNVIISLSEQKRTTSSNENGTSNATDIADGDMIRQTLRTRLRTFDHEQVKSQTWKNRPSQTGGSTGSMSGAGGGSQPGWHSGEGPRPNEPAGGGASGGNK